MTPPPAPAEYCHAPNWRGGSPYPPRRSPRPPLHRRPHAGSETRRALLSSRHRLAVSPCWNSWSRWPSWPSSGAAGAGLAYPGPCPHRPVPGEPRADRHGLPAVPGRLRGPLAADPLDRAAAARPQSHARGDRPCRRPGPPRRQLGPARAALEHRLCGHTFRTCGCTPARPTRRRACGAPPSSPPARSTRSPCSTPRPKVTASTSSSSGRPTTSAARPAVPGAPTATPTTAAWPVSRPSRSSGGRFPPSGSGSSCSAAPRARPSAASSTSPSARPSRAWWTAGNGTRGRPRPPMPTSPAAARTTSLPTAASSSATNCRAPGNGPCDPGTRHPGMAGWHAYAAFCVGMQTPNHHRLGAPHAQATAAWACHPAGPCGTISENA